MEDLLILHKATSPVQHSEFSWKTCLREIIFLHPTHSDDLTRLPINQFEIFKSREALVFLLEVLCGLHSPITGETQILGQFKSFIEQMRTKKNPLFHCDRKWLRFILQEVKDLRAHHMVGLGSQSYGSLLRKRIRSEATVAIFGSGKLSQEIIPWLAPTKKLQVYSRSGQLDLSEIKIDSELSKNIRVVNYQELLSSECLIIAAPVADEVILETLAKAKIKPVIYDLRGENNKLGQYYQNTISLNCLFSELSEQRKSCEQKIADVKNEIRQKVEQFIMRSECRPFGWDDLCA